MFGPDLEVGGAGGSAMLVAGEAVDAEARGQERVEDAVEFELRVAQQVDLVDAADRSPPVHEDDEAEKADRQEHREVGAVVEDEGAGDSAEEERPEDTRE